MKLIGKRATFTPNISGKPDRENGLEFVDKTTGKVVYVNEEHQYFRVEYEAYGHVMNECFKFSQIGNEVVIRG